MKLNDYQHRVASFRQAHNLESALESKLLDLTSEVGELAKKHLRITQYGKREFVPNSTWVLELGDVFYSLITVANETQIDLNEALTDAMAKYLQRIESKGEPGSA